VPDATARHWLKSLLDGYESEQSERIRRREVRFAAVRRRDAAISSLQHACRYLEREHGFNGTKAGANAFEAACVITCCLARLL
jgi:hypothetical protein